MKTIKHFAKLINSYGLNLNIFVLAIRGTPKFILNYIKLLRNWKNRKDREFKSFPTLFPCPSDRYESGGAIKGHYFQQDLLVAQLIFKRKPDSHLDIGSRVDGFVAHLAVFMKVDVVDVRKIISRWENITFIMSELVNFTNTTNVKYESVSCLHALEHFGLSRYGEQFDIDGHLCGIDSLHNILANNGILYLSVPIGKSKIQFDAHRIFSHKHLLKLFNEKFKINEFYIINDDGEVSKFMGTDSFDSSDIIFGCAIYVLFKI